MSGVDEEVAISRDGFAMVLIGPTGVVTIAFDAQCQISMERSGVRLAIIQSFQRR